ncbi:MAG TPA: transglycosylase SLT domain-containing protein [Anaeromyxobacter sp.]|nr:transglycosylase SLT domain-containing protein [Anaeromyxobacter sp.]
MTPPRRGHRDLALRLATASLVGVLATPASRADEMYSFVDGQGVIHYTNVPQDRRYHLVDGGGVHHVAKAPHEPRLHRAKQRGGTTGGPPRITTASGAGRVTPSLPGRTSAFDEHIRAAAQKYGLAPPLLKAVMAAESNFDPTAISEKGAAGLMQLMPETARDMYVYDMFDPAQNIDGGARYLRLLQIRFGGDLERVLAAYNAGPERVCRSGGAVPAIPETRAYVRRVLGLYQAYAKGR